jgi:hypothetical protein
MNLYWLITALSTKMYGPLYWKGLCDSSAQVEFWVCRVIKGRRNLLSGREEEL